MYFFLEGKKLLENCIKTTGCQSGGRVPSGGLKKNVRGLTKHYLYAIVNVQHIHMKHSLHDFILRGHCLDDRKTEKPFYMTSYKAS